MSSNLFKIPAVTKMEPQNIPLVGCNLLPNLQINFNTIDQLINSKQEMVAVLHSSKNDSDSLSLSLNPEWKSIDVANGSPLQDYIDSTFFKGFLGKSVCVRYGNNSMIKIMAIVGAGNPIDLASSKNCCKIGNEIARLVKQQMPKSISIVIPDFIGLRQIQGLIEAFFVDIHVDNRFKSSQELKNKVPKLSQLNIVSSFPIDQLKSVIESAKIMAQSIFFCMELSNAPANYCNTVCLANAAVEMAEQSNLKINILDQEEIEKLNMGCYLGVAKGSLYPPKFIHITYTGEGPIKKKIAMIGKGLCFDSGGYNIKTSSMEQMKFDMCGSAAVLGSAMAIGNLKPKGVEVHFIVAAAENMVSEKAYRPGDILTASNGKTVEIGNTDAEGRLTLADALVYAEKLNVDSIIDIATLTGACVVALGNEYAGMWSDNEELAKNLLDSAKASGEYIWQMPLVKEYRESFDSKTADMNNIAGGKTNGGAIIAALFLKEFVQSTPWAHVDIAGPAWNIPEGKSTGFGVRTLTQYVLKSIE